LRRGFESGRTGYLDEVNTVRRELLGAWLMRRSPSGIGVAALVASGVTARWCVRPSYRLGLIRPGDRLLLWLSGRDPLHPRGLWAAGAIAGTSDGETVGIRLRALSRPLTDVELRSHGIDDLEVQRQPMGSNPSWVSRRQWTQISSLLDSGDAEV
jgi:hypothetical protein